MNRTYVPIARSVTITVRITAVHGHVVLVRPAAHHEAPEQRPEAEAHAKLRGFLAGGEGGQRLDIGRNDGLDDETQKPVDEQASAKRREHRGEGADMGDSRPRPMASSPRAARQRSRPRSSYTPIPARPQASAARSPLGAS